ncbi:MAG: NlpC/P60 family protein [Gaiellales bacterium]
MIIAAPASAGWKTHRAPAFQRAVIAVRATDAQTIAAHRELTGARERRGAVQRRLVRVTRIEHAVRRALISTPVVSRDATAGTLLSLTKERVGLERTLRGLNEDMAYTRTLVAKAQQRRAVVLGGLSLEMRQRVLRADRARQHAARARRSTMHRQALLEPIALEPQPDTGANGSDLARQLDGAPAVPDASGPGAIAAAYALTELGARYTAGGYSPKSGFDCSGLVYWAFAQAGHDVPRSSWQIWDAGRRVTRADAQPGDIVSFHDQGHVGIYLGDGLYVHSTKSGDVVRVHALADRSDLDGFVRLGECAAHASASRRWPAATLWGRCGTLGDHASGPLQRSSRCSPWPSPPASCPAQRRLTAWPTHGPRLTRHRPSCSR